MGILVSVSCIKFYQNLSEDSKDTCSNSFMPLSGS